MEGQRNLNVHNVGRKHHGQCWIRRYTSSHKDSQKRGWKGDRKGNGKGTQKGGKFKGGKGGNHGKRKGGGKKGQRLNEITEPSEEQWTGGSCEQWSEHSWNTEADTASWRDDDWYTADSTSQTSAAAEELQHASVGDLRLSNLGSVKHIESFQRDRLDPSQRSLELEDEVENGSRMGKKVQNPREPTEEERAQHQMTHLPYGSWCRHCVRGRVKQIPQGA